MGFRQGVTPRRKSHAAAARGGPASVAGMKRSGIQDWQTPQKPE
jgi:hypothetical protein